MDSIQSAVLHEPESGASCDCEDAQRIIKLPVTEGKKAVEIRSSLMPGPLIRIPAHSDRFAVGSFFSEANVDCPPIISDEGFQDCFGDMTEEPFPEQSLRGHYLSGAFVNSSLLEELGGPERSVVPLAAMFWLLNQQKQGEPGTLLTHRPNLWYAWNKDHLFRECCFQWGDIPGKGVGWRIRAHEVKNPTVWTSGSLVITP